MSAAPARLFSLATASLIAGTALTTGAMADPGTPGVPQDPIEMYSENFQNVSGPDPILRLDGYTGATGQTYTADTAWLSDCNGWIASANQSTTAADQIADCAGAQQSWNQAQRLSWALGLHAGQSETAARDNYSVSAYTAGNPGGGAVEFETATNIPFLTSNRFVSFAVNVAAVNCTVSAPLLQFSLVDEGGGTTPAGSQINACASGTPYSVPALGVVGAGNISAGTYSSNGAVLISGASVGIRMVNNNGSGVGNDHAFDIVAMLDSTPQLDKEFSPENLLVGETATLTFTITNTSELGAKNGWSFTDELPSGLTVASSTVETTCPAGVVNAPVDGSTIDVSGNLTAGLASCTATVEVTATSAGTYTNDESNITSSVGINPPGETTVTFGGQPSFGSCDSRMFLAQTPSAGAVTTLYDIDTSSNPFTYPIRGVSTIGYNAAGYNPVDNYIYAVPPRPLDSDGLFHLLRIGSDGSSADLGPISGGGINITANGIATGEIGPDGTYYIKQNVTSNVMWRVDLATRTATAVTLSQPIAQADLAWSNGLLYAHDHTSGLVYSINSTSGAVTTIGQSGITGSSAFGGMIGASNGVYGAHNTGGFYKFNLETGRAALISDSPASLGNDAAKCVTTPVTFPADTWITKTNDAEIYTPGTDVTYEIVVGNDGPFGVLGALVSDPLPDGITDATWTCGDPVNGGFCSVDSGTGPITDVSVDLPADSSVTFTLTLTVPEDYTGDLVNTATVTNPPDVPDPDTSTNTSTDIDIQPEPAMTMEKTGLLNDSDGNNLIDPGETITYSFLVENTGNVALTDVTVNDPLLEDAGVSLDQDPQTLEPGDSFTFTATYQPTREDIEAGNVENTAVGTGTPPGPNQPPIESPPDTVTVPPAEPSLHVEKQGVFNDADGDGYATIGDTLTYTIIVTNDGNTPVDDVWPNDEGPTFNGNPAEGDLSDFRPAPMTLQPGVVQEFTATYTLTQADIDNAAGIKDSVANSATARGTTTGGDVPSNTSTNVITPPAAAPSDIGIIKIAQLRQIRRGERAPFLIRVTNNANRLVGGLTVTDTLPSGFRYVDGSASLDGEKVTPVVNGLRVRFEDLTLEPNSELVIRLQALALSSAGPGEHTNRASATDRSGKSVSNEATAVVEILAEPVFDCGDVIGKVFDDKNHNGYQDAGEPGLPGVRLATVRGWLITTDEHGRFHVACAMLPDQRIGSNFIMKLDTRTLPTGYRVTTENPRVIRLTAGKMTKLNFGASIGRVVRLDLKDEAFVPGGVELGQRWEAGVDQLIDMLRQEQSVLRVSYVDTGADPELARTRLRRLKELIADRWRRRGGRYQLEIETRVEVGQ